VQIARSWSRSKSFPGLLLVGASLAAVTGSCSCDDEGPNLARTGDGRLAVGWAVIGDLSVQGVSLTIANQTVWEVTADNADAQVVEVGTSPPGFETVVPFAGDPDDISTGDVTTTHASGDGPSVTTVIPIVPENLPDPSVVAAVEEVDCGFSVDVWAFGRGLLWVGLLATVGVVAGALIVLAGLGSLRRTRAPARGGPDDS
jgi:hypothetical protein